MKEFAAAGERFCFLKKGDRRDLGLRRVVDRGMISERSEL